MEKKLSNVVKPESMTAEEWQKELRRQFVEREPLSSLGKNLTSHIHNAYLGGLSTDIDADNIRRIHFIHTYIIYYSTGISLFTFLQPTSA